MAQNKRDFIPLIMGFTLLGGIVTLSSLRSMRGIGAWNECRLNIDTLFVGLYLLWMILELRISKKDVNTDGKKTSDFMTCQLYGAGQAFTILTALWFPSIWRGPSIAHGVGMGIFLAGVGYRLWAVRSLGQYYSHRVRTISEHQIVDSGPYRFSRHPAYAGMIIANSGMSIYFCNWATICVFLFILVPAIILRIVIEEKILFGIVGYSEFAKKRKRLFPGIW